MLLTVCEAAGMAELNLLPQGVISSDRGHNEDNHSGNEEDENVHFLRLPPNQFQTLKFLELSCGGYDTRQRLLFFFPAVKGATRTSIPHHLGTAATSNWLAA